MLIVTELKVWQRELLFQQGSELIEDRLGPVADQNDELVDSPGDATARNLGVVALELGLLMGGLSFEELLASIISSFLT